MTTIFPFDSPRARRVDPLSSHVAADKSAETRGAVHEAVIELITKCGPLKGREINDKYAAWRYESGWPVVAYDSPRKRAAELVGSRLVVLNPDDPRGVPHFYGVRGVDA